MQGAEAAVWLATAGKRRADVSGDLGEVARGACAGPGKDLRRHFEPNEAVPNLTKSGFSSKMMESMKVMKDPRRPRGGH